MKHKRNAIQGQTENASRPGVNGDTAELHTTSGCLWRGFFTWRARCWLCEKLCADHFFNRDASREIDRLTVENERLRAEGGTR